MCVDANSCNWSDDGIRLEIIRNEKKIHESGSVTLTSFCLFTEKNKSDEVTVHRVRTYNIYFIAWTDGIQNFLLNLVTTYFGTLWPKGVTNSITFFIQIRSRNLASQQCTIDYLFYVSKCSTLLSSTTLIFIILVDVFLVTVVVVFLLLSHYNKFIRFYSIKNETNFDSFELEFVAFNIAIKSANKIHSHAKQKFTFFSI